MLMAQKHYLHCCKMCCQHSTHSPSSLCCTTFHECQSNDGAFRFAFFWDPFLLAKHVWGPVTEFGPMVCSHSSLVAAMRLVRSGAKALAISPHQPKESISRSSECHPATDISMHMQFESYLRFVSTTESISVHLLIVT